MADGSKNIPATFYRLEAIREQGFPTVVDKINFTVVQANVFVNIVRKAMLEAGHSQEIAIDMAMGVFRRMHEVKDGLWLPRKWIRLDNGSNKWVRNKFFKREEQELKEMRIKSKRADEQAACEEMRQAARLVLEAGARNSKNDKSAIRQIIQLAVKQLNKPDIDAVMDELGIQRVVTGTPVNGLGIPDEK